ncbi:MAG: GPW/gp25 family protein [Pyrinomonadaceae bacterium]
MDATGFGFPFRINGLGQVARAGGDERVRARIMQVLLTSPGERVGLPEFGCSLRDLAFDPDNVALAAAAEFSIATALERWVGDEIVVEGVEVTGDEGRLEIEVVYLRRDQLGRGRVRVSF